MHVIDSSELMRVRTACLINFVKGQDPCWPARGGAHPRETRARLELRLKHTQDSAAAAAAEQSKPGEPMDDVSMDPCPGSTSLAQVVLQSLPLHYQYRYQSLAVNTLKNYFFKAVFTINTQKK